MTHKHHERGDGEPQIGSDDVFVLVRNPLGKVPTYFVGHTTAHGVHEVPSRVAGKRMDSLTARAWSSFLEKPGLVFRRSPSRTTTEEVQAHNSRDDSQGNLSGVVVRYSPLLLGCKRQSAQASLST